ncbi:hypothetical protein SAMN05444411_10282 [Lutibacter oricola]|uniref:Outer membrane protein beta-barrel domain-containing protein n=1 Tax=Lutibacter oricola TaxID=762486 RepID=A0A1H2W1C0_9FLAO|nr:hypothetical protein [Lutibacter oricola]SDW74044.1 hypothetical protein SAMN05444411_10282 [Lutibacter oricola]
MKKIILLTFLLVGMLQTSFAQDISNNALGIRLGDNDGFGGEISYQHKINHENRFELDLGYKDKKEYSAFKLSGIYQWVWNIDGGFNWYAGFGAGIGSWSYSNGYETEEDDGLFLNADGNVGIEYNFRAPFLISLDFRPEIGVLGDYGKDTDLDLALSIRYQF